MPQSVRLTLPLAVLAASVALSACGAGAKKSDPPPSAGGSSAATSEEQDSARVKLTQCLREQTGIDVPDAGGGGAFAQLTPAERQRVQDALEGPCRKYQSDAFGHTDDPQSQPFLDTLTRFTVCLRKNGADVPDPDPNEPFSVLHTLDQSDPTIARAMAACQDKLAALNGGR